MKISDKQSTIRDDWLLSYDEYNPDEEGKRESLSALGNGYYVTRAAQTNSQRSNIFYPGTYAAGLYNRTRTSLAGHTEENEDLVNLPNWLPFDFSINDGDWFDLNNCKIVSYNQTLNIKQGILLRSICFKTESDELTTFKEQRFVHMRHFHLAAQELEITPHNWSGKITIKISIDGKVENKGAFGYRYLNSKHLVHQESQANDNLLYFKSKTNQSNITIAQATRIMVEKNGKQTKFPSTYSNEQDRVSQSFSLDINKSDSLRIEKICSLYTSRDWGISEPGEQAKYAVTKSPRFDKLKQDQIEEWKHLWNKFDLVIEAENAVSEIPLTLLLHLNSFHVLQTASSNSIDIDCGIPARGWTGEAYRGHVFWDDLFVFPFLNLRMPEITQSLLRYRYRRLNEARELAKQLGAKGARFPWESASCGSEETPKHHWSQEKMSWVPVRTNLQIHVNAAIAYNIWQYYQVTGDLDLINAYGAEVLFEIARFFASYAKLNSKTNRYEILNVAGPDEFHQAYPGSKKQGINNNAYTNVMAAWTLDKALELHRSLPEDHRAQLSEKLNLSEAELKTWKEVSRRIYIPWHKDGIINQFDGYETLDEFPYKKNGKIDCEKLKTVLEEQGGHLNQYKVSKQADVLMLFYVFSAEELEEIFSRLGYKFPLNTIPSTVSYYMNLTVNHSTLSRVSHAWVLSRLNRPHSWRILSKIFPSRSQNRKEDNIHSSIIPEGWNVFLEALSSDYNDIQGGTTSEGIHMGAMAGTIDIIQRGYTGIVTRDDVLWFNPFLPKELKRLAFNIHYRSQSLRFDITRKTVTVKAHYSSAKPVDVGFLDKVYSLSSGEQLTFNIEKGVLINEPETL